jgi:cytochrome P450
MTTEPFVFNPYAPGHDADPSPVYRQLREHHPVYRWERGRAFILSRYHDVVALMKDPRFSRSVKAYRYYQPIPDLPEYADFRSASDHSILMSDHDDHLRLRRLINPAFTPKAVGWMREHTRQITAEALDLLPDDEVVDLAPFTDFIPLRVIGRQLGIPRESEPMFLAFARARTELLTPGLPPARVDELIRALGPGFSSVRSLIEQRRGEPGDDLLSILIQHEEDGDRVSDAELLALVGALIAAGSDTTVHTLRFMLLDLLRNPEQLALVRKDPSLARAAMEESLRYDHFSRLGLPMYALEDLELHGVPIAKGEMVFSLSGSAGRDASAFERPDEFDIQRPDLAMARNFGAGAHLCLGIHLARMETEVAIPMILERFPDMSLAGPPEFIPHFLFRQMNKLPVRVRGTAA